MIKNDNKLNYSLKNQISVNSIGEIPKYSSLILDIISEPRSYITFISCLMNCLQCCFHFASIQNNKLLLALKPVIYASRTFGQRWISSVETKLTPKFCC